MSASTPAPSTTPGPSLDPVNVLKAFASLRRLLGTYPSGHPMIAQKLHELDDLVRLHLRRGPALEIDVIDGDVRLDGVSFGGDRQANAQAVRELSDLGIDSIHIREGVEIEELRATAEFLWQFKDTASGDSLESQLARRGVHHISLARLVRLDTRWRSHQWPDAPTGPLDPAYAESLALAEQTFDTVASGRKLDAMTVRGLVELLIYRVARSNAALGQILAVKQYENLTYCHSVNVSVLSLLLALTLYLSFLLIRLVFRCTCGRCFSKKLSASASTSTTTKTPAAKKKN